MKKVRNLVIGGIQSKIFNLILLTVLLLLGVYLAISLYQSHTLSQLTRESGSRQEQAIEEISGAVMDKVVTQTLERSNKSEALIVDKMFRSTGRLVDFLTRSAEFLLANAGDYGPKPCAEPDPRNDGVWTGKVIYAEGVDPQDPEIAAKVGLFANLTDVMISMCQSYGAENAYIGLPEGVFLCISDIDSSWFENGSPRVYDARERIWYRKAAERGTLIFTDGEYDADTGKFCVECACPIYGPDGELAGVAGVDLYLDEIEAVLAEADIEGEYQLLINEGGQVVLEPQAAAFPMTAEDRAKGLLASGNPLLAQIAETAILGSGTEVLRGQLSDGEYYVTAAPIPSTGWALISAYSQQIAGEPALLLQQKNAEIQEAATAEYLDKMGHSRWTAIVLLVFVTLLTLGGAILLGTRIVKPLNTITNRIANLGEGNLEFKMEDAYRTGDEVEALAQSFAALSHKTVEYLETVQRVTAEKERIGAELSLATKIQASMLPNIFPPYPNRTEFDVFASMDPAKEVGGDFYDFFLVDEDHLGMVMADVSGKGVPAALFMMASKIILQSCAMLGQSPGEILTKTNEAICSNNQENMFVTVWVGILELSTGKLTAANAGHEYPILRHPGGAFEVYKDRHGLVLGGMPGLRYRQYELTLEPGSKLFLYTDGVPEATDADKQLFGMERTLAALNADPEAEPRQILKNVRRAVDDFVKDAEQFDDLTMLCLVYRGKS